MNVTRKFRSIWKFLVPGWLQTGQGEMVLFVQGLLKDAFAERAHQTARLHYPSTCPSDALEMHGRSRALPRGLFEPDETYRGRLAGWRSPKGHRVRGTAGALLAQLAVALRGTEYQTIDARGTRYTYAEPPTVERNVVWDWDAEPSSQWGRYWLVVKSTGTLPLTWDEDDASETTWDEGPEACWAGEGIHSGEIAAVVRLASNRRLGWTPAGVRGISLVLWFEGEAYPEPDGTWDEWGSRPQQDYAFEPLNESVP